MSSDDGVAFGTGELLPEVDGFFSSNCSTAEVDLPVFPDDLERRSFLKSIKLVFGVPMRSEQVRGISTESLAQLCLPLGCCCWSKRFLGVDLPELLGLLPWERIPPSPLCSFSLFRNSSLNFGFVAGEPVIREIPLSDAAGAAPGPLWLPVGVEVSREASLVSIMFRGLIGEIGSVIESLFVTADEFKELVCDRKKVENPEAGVLGVFVSLLGVEYRSSIFCGCCCCCCLEGVIGGWRFFSCNVQ